MSSIYKILCEVKWLHEYYLIGDKGESIFEQAAQNGRLDYLLSRFIKDLPAIHEDVEFLTTTGSSIFSDYHIRIIPSYSGFKLAIECRKEKLGNGTIVYTPFVPLTDNHCLRILISEKKSIARYSGEITAKPLKTRWYFSNNNVPLARTFPFLTASVPNAVVGQSYVQGELAVHAGVVKTFLNNGALDPWLSLPGTHYANTDDSKILPLSFIYRFDAAEGIISASFSLKDNTNTLVRKVDLSADQPMQAVRVDFRTKDNLVETVSNSAIEIKHVYSLEVTGSNGYAKSFNNLLFADDSMDIEKYAGVIDLVIKPANAAFHLLDGSGRLFTRILANGTREPNPVFEIWMKSKLAYWEYRNNRQRKIKLSPDTQDLLNDNSGILVTKNPVPMTFTPILLKKPDNTYKLLPNPPPGDEVKREGITLLLPIEVPETNMFPLL